MRKFFKGSALFIVTIVFLSSLSGCSGGPEPQNVVDNSAQPVANAIPAEDKPKKKTDYPPIATAVAQGDLKNLDGTTFKVADKKGKVLLLNLWATWCGPCRSEMPTLVKLQEQYRDQGLEILGLNTDDETVEDINKFAADMKLNYTLVWADTEMQTALLRISKFGGIPQSFIVDREGNLRGVFRGANPADVKKMEELVGMIVSE